MTGWCSGLQCCLLIGTSALFRLNISANVEGEPSCIGTVWSCNNALTKPLNCAWSIWEKWRSALGLTDALLASPTNGRHLHKH